MTELTHFDQAGNAHMVDVGAKDQTHRVARAQGFIRMKPETFAMIAQGTAKKGDVIGTVTYSYADQPLATINLVAGESVERSELLKSASTVKDIVTSTWFLAIVGVILFLVVIYIILALIYNRKKKKLRKVRNYKNM